jgi:hypothetical protein
MTQKNIEKLTPEMERLLEQRYKEWFDIGVCTDPADRPTAEEAIAGMYEITGEDPAPFVWFDSPQACVYAIGILNREQDKGVDPKEKVKELVGLSLQELREMAGDVRAVFTSAWGQLDAYWVAFHVFCKEIGIIYEPRDDKLLELWAQTVRSCFWWWPFKELCIISERPNYIHVDKERREVLRHNPDGFICGFRDGWGFCMLNGVQVPPEIVFTPGDKLDVQWVVREKNAQVRTEIVKKIGLERIIKELGYKVLDEKAYPGLTNEQINNKIADFYRDYYTGIGKNPPYEMVQALLETCEMDQKDRTYRLISLDLGEDRIRPFLEMDNPSTHEKHFEGVAPECETVEQALAWRNGDDIETVALT